MSDNENEEPIEGSMTEMLKDMEPMMNDMMDMMNKHVNKKDPSISEDHKDETVKKNPKNNAINNILGILGPIFKSVDKYKDRPYLTILPLVFKGLSNTQDDSDYGKLLKENATIINEMLNDKSIDELYEDPEFKPAVYQIVVNLKKTGIVRIKNQVEKLELELEELNNEIDIDVLLKDLSGSFGKK